MSARELFEDWLTQEPRAPLEELLREHPRERPELLELARRYALAEGALGGAGPPAGGPREFLGRQLGDFRLVAELGRGGMGIVFEAEQLSLHRRVALKILPAQLTLNERAFHRFRREAEITARLKHPHIVDIHQMGEADGITFLVMEKVEGTPLDRLLERMRLEAAGAQTRRPSSVATKGHIESAVRIVCQVADALEHAHAAGVIHRDVKPSNILLRASGEAVLTDFGLAREQGLPGVTGTGEFAGTPSYVSPEQAMAGRVPLDHRTDVFSLGATLYELLTLHPPFAGDSAHTTLAAILSKEPVSPAELNPALAPDLVTIVLKALEKDPDRRYGSARELSDDLRAFVDYRPIRAKRASGVTRTLRWARREPFRAALFGVLALGLPLAGWAALALREKGVLEERLAVESLPGRLEDAFLELGTGWGAKAEESFRDLLEDDPSEEVAAGLVMSLLAQKHATDALTELDHLARTPVFMRLREHALRLAGDMVGAEALNLPEKPAGALESFLVAVGSLSGSPYSLELSDLSYVPFADYMLPKRARGGIDVRRANAANALDAIEYLQHASEGNSEIALYKFAQAWAAWVARDEGTARVVASLIEDKWSRPVARFYVGLASEVFDEDRAIAAYENALKEDPALRVAEERRAQILLRHGDEAKAKEAFERLVAADPDSPVYRAGLAATRLRTEPAAAVRDCALAIGRDPNLTIAFRTQARAFCALRLPEKAAASLRAGLQVEDGDAILHSDLGWVLTELGQWEPAEAELQEAVRLDPGLPFPYHNRGVLALRRAAAEHEAAEKLLAGAVDSLVEAERLAKLRPELHFPLDQLLGTRAEVRFRLAAIEGRSELGAELVELALADLRAACESAPDDAQHAYNLGVQLAVLERLEDAVEPLARGLAHDWSTDEAARLELQLPEAHAKHVWIFEQLGRLDEAEAAARRWTEVYPEDRDAWNALAYALVSRETAPADPDGALAAAKRALEMGPESYEVVDTYALALYWAGEHAQALEMAVRAQEKAHNASASPDTQREIEAHVRRIRAANP